MNIYCHSYFIVQLNQVLINHIDNYIQFNIKGNKSK